MLRLKKRRSRAGGRPFATGYDPRRRRGRRKGELNLVTRDVLAFLTHLVNSPEAQDGFERQIVNGAPGSLQAFLAVAAHVIGRPRETHKIDLSPRMRDVFLLALKPPPEPPPPRPEP